MAKNLEYVEWLCYVIDEFFYMDFDENMLENFVNLEQGLVWLMCSKKIDCIVVFDDFDVEKVAFLCEMFWILGMGQIIVCYFCDKLVMCMKVVEVGILVLLFLFFFNDEEIMYYVIMVFGFWVVKLWVEVFVIGIKKVYILEEFWQVVYSLGDKCYEYLVEQFKFGVVYYVDVIMVDGKVDFCWVFKYLNIFFEVVYGGGIFRLVMLFLGSDDDKVVQKLYVKVMDVFGMQFSVLYMEFIKLNDDGQFYFLEMSLWVGGVYLVEMVEYVFGINLWVEWVRFEIVMAKKQFYEALQAKEDYVGIVVFFFCFQYFDSFGFNDLEIVWCFWKKYYIGMIVCFFDLDCIYVLLDDYVGCIYCDFYVSVLVLDKFMDQYCLFCVNGCLS